MGAATPQAIAKTLAKKERTPLKDLKHQFLMNKWLYFMLLPGIIYFIIFKYGPMWGLLIAFKNYQPFLGFWKSQWVGLEHFQRFFSEPTFLMLFRNTLWIAILNILVCFPLPILLALLLNEVKASWFKRTVQTLTYIPHFMSWVVIAGITYILFTTENGIVNNTIKMFGGREINFLLSAEWFRPLIVGQTLWKETGWGTIIFLAAILNVDVDLYEAARIDGANRFELLWHITLPAIKSTIFTMLILKLGNFLDTGFDQIFLMLNAMNREVGEVFDTYVYTTGIGQGQFSYSVAVGMFKSVVCLILVLAANYIIKKSGEEGII